MDIYELYKSLPPSTIAEVARRTGQSVQNTANRMLRKHKESWEVALQVLADLDEKVETTSAQISSLVATLSAETEGENAD